MKLKEVFTLVYLLHLGFITMGSAVAVEWDYYEHLFFASVWSALITAGVYFSLTVKSKILSMVCIGFVGWLFSMFTFEVIGIFAPEAIAEVNKPSATFVWYVMAFMVYAVLIFLRYGRATD